MFLCPECGAPFIGIYDTLVTASAFRAIFSSPVRLGCFASIASKWHWQIVLIRNTN